jgi:hypothetical protein
VTRISRRSVFILPILFLSIIAARISVQLCASSGRPALFSGRGAALPAEGGAHSFARSRPGLPVAGRTLPVVYRQSAPAAEPAPRTVIVGINVFRQPEGGQARRLAPGDMGLKATGLDASGGEAQALSRWLGLERPACAVFCESPSLIVTAVHGPEGAAVCVGNPTREKFLLKVRARLDEGVYRVETASLSQGAGATAQPSAAGNTDRQPPLRIARTSPRLLGSPGVIVKPWELGPGEWVAMRFTNEAEAAHSARAEIWSALSEQAGSAPALTARIERVLRDGGGGNLRSGGPNRVRSIHHALLLLAQASAMQRNALERRIVDHEAGQRALAAMDDFAHALAETSACILGLVPQIEVEAKPSGPGGELEGTVTVSLLNAGAASVANVKIGMDLAAMPADAVCEPADVESFGSVAPGQTVRAGFHVRLPASAAPGSRQVEGDVSYFFAGAPAHLRPRLLSW